MPSALIIPGVQVKTEFEPSPALPGATGILGVVGVADRGPVAPTQVGNFGEFIELFGPASRYTLPEVRGAFANGVSRVVVGRLAPGRGQKASLVLKDDDGEDNNTDVLVQKDGALHRPRKEGKDEHQHDENGRDPMEGDRRRVVDILAQRHWLRRHGVPPFRADPTPPCRRTGP